MTRGRLGKEDEVSYIKGAEKEYVEEGVGSQGCGGGEG